MVLTPGITRLFYSGAGHVFAIIENPQAESQAHAIDTGVHRNRDYQGIWVGLKTMALI